MKHTGRGPFQTFNSHHTSSLRTVYTSFTARLEEQNFVKAITIPSPWSNLLTSNGGPQDNEAQTIRQVIVGAKHKITELKKIAGPLPAVEKKPYKKQISDLIDFVGGHRAVVSPLRTLPPELLAEIFLHVVPYLMSIMGRNHTAY